jgi:hypothetical protein
MQQSVSMCCSRLMRSPPRPVTGGARVRDKRRRLGAAIRLGGATRVLFTSLATGPSSDGHGSAVDPKLNPGGGAISYIACGMPRRSTAASSTAPGREPPRTPRGERTRGNLVTAARTVFE